MAQDQYKYFRQEARELLDRFTKTILEVEVRRADAAQMQLLLRLAHTLKGAARVVKQSGIADRAHAIEDILEPYRLQAENLPATSIPGLLVHVDEMRRLVEALAQPVSAGAPAKEAAPVSGSAPAVAASGTVPPSAPAFAFDESLRSVRVDLAEMDSLLESVSETHTLLNGLRPSHSVVEQTRHLADLLLEQLKVQGAGPVGAEGPARQMAGTIEELRRNISRLERDLGIAIDQMDRELRQLREAAEQLRLVPAKSVFVLLERTVRDAARTLSKQVSFEAQGGDLRLDAYVLSVIQPALIQIARNAVAHGIESQEERKANGKPPAGRISVSVHHSGGRIVFTCRDDGRGINLEAVRRAARERGLPEQQAAGLTSDDILHLLLGGGLSTAKSVTAISGRGIGLDIVREAMEQLDGKVSFQTDRHGTSFDLSVPMSLFSLDAILVEAGDFSAALPLGAVQGALRLAPNQISAGQSTLSVVHDGAAYSFLPLSAALLGKPAMLDRTWQGLLVSGSVGSAVVGTDRLLGTARIVSRPLPQAAPASEIVSGTWFDASGNPQLVLDPAGLVSAAHRASVSVGEQAPRGLPILVVDDSLTSRTLEQSILESEGFDVDAAASAEEGLQAARRRKYGLFLVDVDMPGMSGFEFVETVRGDAELRDIPAVMVTSRSSPEDRARGRNAGAQGYIVKGEFDQVELLALIRSLIG